MKPMVIVVIVAGLAAGMTALLARSWLDRQASARTEHPEAVQVLIVARKVAPGTVLQSDDLRYEAWPASLSLPRLIVRNDTDDPKARYVGQMARRGLAEGEPLTVDAINATGDLGLMASRLTPGMRAVSVAITNSSAVSGFITPGDRVDIVLAADLSKTVEGDHRGAPVSGALVRFASETVLSDVRILAIDQQLARAQDGAAIQGKTATVEVTPKQAEILTTVGMLGNLQLVLRGKAGDETAPATAAPGFSADIEVSRALQAMLERKEAPLAPPRHASAAVMEVNRAGAITRQGVSK